VKAAVGKPSEPGVGARVLLVGEAAVLLAPRLALSGYRPLADKAGDGEPQAVVLAPGSEARLEGMRQRWGGVPILLGVRGDSIEERMRCLSSGADDFWLTDRPPSDLLARLRLHLQLAGRATPPKAELRLGDLVVLPACRQVRRADRELKLTEREYQLLELLLRHRNEVVSRERILACVWPGGGGAASNVIEVYVRYLRQKLEQNGARRLLHTVRGLGYCLAERWPPEGESR
jgi:DNA-binding response OmpR family regulator